MKKSMYVLLTATASILLLAACGADSKEVKPDTEKPSVEKPEAEVEGGTESTQPDTLKDATVVPSDEQEYKISVLPEYSLESEEPGRDSLSLNEDGSIFMRIESAPKSDSSYDTLHENMKEVLAASANGASPKEITDTNALPTGEGIQNAKSFSVEDETGVITGILFERNDMIVRLTIYDNADQTHFEKFLRMGETIQMK